MRTRIERMSLVEARPITAVSNTVQSSLFEGGVR